MHFQKKLPPVLWCDFTKPHLLSPVSQVVCVPLTGELSEIGAGSPGSMKVLEEVVPGDG